jgi:hypothetical protein
MNGTARTKRLGLAAIAAWVAVAAPAATATAQVFEPAPVPQELQNGQQCWQSRDDGNPPVFSPQATYNWQQSVAAADPNVMAQMAGTYYGEIPSPAGDAISRQYRRFSSNGLFDYQDQTCGTNGGVCSQNQGTGSWVAHQQQDGTIFLMVNFSDMVRTAQCFSDTVQIGPQGMQSYTGMVWQRTQ